MRDFLVIPVSNGGYYFSTIKNVQYDVQSYKFQFIPVSNIEKNALENI